MQNSRWQELSRIHFCYVLYDIFGAKLPFLITF